MATATREKPATAVAEAKKAAVPALSELDQAMMTLSELDQAMMEDAGQGISNDAADNLVPQISVLQPLSPEVMDGPTKVEGAAPGCFLLGATVVRGSDGVWFQPCHFDQVWLEFQPLDKGGGFVASHPFRGTGANGMALPPEGSKARDKNRWTLNDNEVIHYRQVAGIAWVDGVGLEYVIPFKSTGHTVAKDWMTTAGRAHRFPDGRQRPLYGHVYRLTTEMRQNASGRWYQVRVGEPVLVTDPVAVEVVRDPGKAYAMGKALCAAFETNQKAAAVTESAAEPAKVDDDKIPF